MRLGIIQNQNNMPVGRPGDSDPNDEVPEWKCPECGGIVIPTGKYTSECLDCEEEFESDVTD